ncbi:hypothetical protein BESB_021390 [Besnoitia besnoiti]|uniref:Uncharacterized protein n=1 Tax=Besnoitia besnoiti TaxID=94643 RepID=A0A2A9M0W9_BESBE|nr:hypothetical protein BESB_021390 [Besnoitia besnoiti]PFH32198.1 hypothetical protein BESB_021390 [Besnoitia besnoiti]
MDYSSSELPSVPEETDEEYAERLQKWVDSAATHLGTAKAQATRDEELTDETGLWEGHSFSKPMPSAITADEEPGGARQEEELSPHPRSSAITAKEKQRAAGQDNDLSPEPAPSAGTGEEEQGRGGQDNDLSSELTPSRGTGEEEQGRAGQGNDLSSELAPSRGTGEEEQGRAGREALPTVPAIPITEAQEGTRQDSQLSARHSPTGTDGGPHVEVSEEKGDLNGLESDQQNGTPTVIQQSRDQSAAARQQVVACLDKLQSAPTAVDPKKVCGGAKNGSFDKCVERVTHWIQSGSLDCLLVNFEVEAAGGRSLTVVLPENASEFLYFARLYQVLKRGPCRDLPNETEFGRAVAASMYTTPEALGR